MIDKVKEFLYNLIPYYDVVAYATLLIVVGVAVFS